MSWTICKDFDIVTRDIEDETLAYHWGSGDTHRLNNAAGLLLKLLMNAEQPLSAEQLIYRGEQAGLSVYDMQTVENVLQLLSVLKFVKKVN